MFQLFPGVSIFAQTPNIYEDSLIALSGNGSYVAVSGRAIEDPSSNTGRKFLIDIYDTTTGEIILEHPASDFQITYLAMSPDGQKFSYTNLGGRLSIVDITGDIIIDLGEGNSMEVEQSAWHPTDNLFAFATGRVVALYDTDEFQSYGTAIDENNFDGVFGFSWHPITPQIAVVMRSQDSGDTSILIWNIESENNISLQQTVPISAFSQLSWHPDGHLLATNQRGGVKIIDLETESETIITLPDSEDPIRAIAWHPDGHQISAGGNHSVYIWDIETQMIVETIPTESRVRNVFWSPDGEYIYHSGGSAGIYRNGIPLQEAIIQN